jgi:hypothetical protein
MAPRMMQQQQHPKMQKNVMSQTFMNYPDMTIIPAALLLL